MNSVTALSPRYTSFETKKLREQNFLYNIHSYISKTILITVWFRLTCYIWSRPNFSILHMIDCPGQIFCNVSYRDKKTSCIYKYELYIFTHKILFYTYLEKRVRHATFARGPYMQPYLVNCTLILLQFYYPRSQIGTPLPFYICNYR